MRAKKVAGASWLFLIRGGYMWRFKNKRVQFIQIDVAYTDYLRKHIDLRIP